MFVELQNVYCRVATATAEEKTWLWKYLSFEDASARFRKWSRDDRIRMVDAASWHFLSGFLELVKQGAAKAGIKVEVIDRRTWACLPQLGVDTSWLRDYQTQGAALAALHERGIFHWVTSAGKTELMAALTLVYPCKWLFLMHRQDLVVQTANRIKDRTGMMPGLIMQGQQDLTQRVTVGMFQSVYASLRVPHMKGFLQKVEALGVDEVHTTPAKTFMKCITQTSNAYYRYGFSGTPFARGDQKSIYLLGAIGPTIHRVGAQDLETRGVIALPHISMYELSQTSTAGTWAEAYTDLVAHSAPRNQRLADCAVKATKPCFLFVKHVDHGLLLERALRARGLSVEFVWGEKDLAVRQAAIKRMVRGDTDVLICSVIFQEGIDVPELQSVILGSGSASIIAALQSVGRGMRRHARDGQVTKEAFTVYDVYDIGCGCKGKRHKACKWMEDHTLKRVQAYRSENYKITLVRTR